MVIGVLALQGAFAALAGWGFWKGYVQASHTVGWAIAAESAWLAAHQMSLFLEAWARVSGPRGRG